MRKQLLKTTLLILFSLLFFVINIYGQTKIADSLTCLEIKGKILNVGNKQDDTYKVELIYYNTVINSDTISCSKYFKYNLKKMLYTLLEFQKRAISLNS